MYILSDNRNSSMDLARVVACVMVICLHITAAWKYGVYGTFEWNISVIYDCLSRSAVPLFFMISGAFYKKAKLIGQKEKIEHFILIFFLVSAFYSFSDAYYNSICGIEIENNILNAILNYKYHLWYIPAYIFILIVAPIIVKIMEEEVYGKYMLAIWVIFSISLGTLQTAISGFDEYSLFNQYLGFISSFSFLTGNHVGYFILGRYLIGYELTNQKRKILYVLGALSTFALYRLTDIYSSMIGYGDERL